MINHPNRSHPAAGDNLSKILGYATYGNVRGLGPTLHRTLDAAQAAVARDQAGCRKQGGYSDRDVYLVDQDRFLRPLWTAHEEGDILETSDAYVWPSHGRSSGAVKF